MLKRLATIIVLLVFLVSCAAQAPSIKKTLYSSKVTYNNLIEGLQKAYDENLISQEDAIKINELAVKYITAHNAAVDLLALADVDPAKAQPDRVTSYLDTASNLLAELIELATKYGVKP